MSATAEQIVTTAKSFGPAKRIYLRRHLHHDGWGDMTIPLARSIEKMCGTSTVEEVRELQGNVDAAYTAKAHVVAQHLVEEGYDAETVTSGSFIDILKQLLAVLMPLLVNCIPKVP